MRTTTSIIEKWTNDKLQQFPSVAPVNKYGKSVAPVNKYGKSVVYQIKPIIITNPDSGVYIGGTSKSLTHRFNQHKAAYIRYQQKEPFQAFNTVYTLFDQFGVDGCTIEMLELYPCTSRLELRIREQYYIDAIPNHVNIKKAYISKEDSVCLRKIYQRDWYEKNKKHVAEYMKNTYAKNRKHILEYHRNYYEKNREHILEYHRNWHTNNREHILEYHRNWYAKNKKHVAEYMKNTYLNNREHILEYHRNYYEKNKDHIKKWYEKNKERIAKQRKEYYIKNKNALKDLQKKWVNNNPDYAKNYYKKNREIILERSKKYYYDKKKKIVPTVIERKETPHICIRDLLMEIAAS